MTGARRIGNLCLWIATAVLCGPSPAAAQDVRPSPDVIRVDVDLVTLRFSVKDAQGRFVNNLSREDVRIFENGREREIRFFERPKSSDRSSSGLWLAFLIDVSGSTLGTRAEQILAAETFFDNLQSFTRVGIFGFTDKLIEFQDFTSDRRSALKSFAEARRHLGQTAIYQSLNALMTQMQRAAPPGTRKAVIVISDGDDKEHQRSAQSIALARQQNVTLYTILVPSAAQLYIRPDAASSKAPKLSATDRGKKQQRSFLRLSQQTDGLHFSGFGAILDFDQTLAQITDSVFGNLYSVAYPTPNPSLRKDQRDIEIELRSPLLRASAPFSSLPESLNAKKEYITALFGDSDELRDIELDRQYREIGATIDILQPRSHGGETGQPFRIKVNPMTLRGDSKGVHTQLGIVGQLINSRGKEVARLREIVRVEASARDIAMGRGFIYTNKLMAPPGVYNFRVAVLEVATWRMSAFEASVRID